MPLFLVLALIASACIADEVPSGEAGQPADTSMGVLRSGAITTTTAEPVTTSTIDQPAALLESLTVEQKVGQLLMPLVAGTSEDGLTASERSFNRRTFGVETPAEATAALHLGGVIYLQDNIRSAVQVGQLSADLQEAALDAVGIGMLIAVDQEGGRVSRLTDGVTVLPPAALLAGDEATVEEAGYLTGRQVAGQGVNMVLAPVADLTWAGSRGAIGNRSFGDDPALVSSMVRASIAGLQASGVAAVVKHWPGHGATEVDSHDSLPTLTIGEAEWENRDRIPFEAAIDEQVDAVLIGHLTLPSVDPSGEPATTSSVLVQKKLRDELGFDGVVITDALNMGAVGGYDPDQLAVDAVNAGVDIILMPLNPAGAHAAMVAAVQSGEISEEQLDAAVLRVLRLKDRLGLVSVERIS